MDLMGRFPYQSSRGHEYILVAYNYDGNAILAQPLKIEKLRLSLMLGPLYMNVLQQSVCNQKIIY